MVRTGFMHVHPFIDITALWKISESSHVRISIWKTYHSVKEAGCSRNHPSVLPYTVNLKVEHCNFLSYKLLSSKEKIDMF